MVCNGSAEVRLRFGEVVMVGGDLEVWEDVKSKLEEKVLEVLASRRTRR